MIKLTHTIATVKDAPITIGADPELILLNPTSGSIVTAGNLIKDENRKNKFGLDGCATTAELRPTPTTDPIELANNIKRMLKGYSKNKDWQGVYNLVLKCSHAIQPIGGHIQFGHPSLRRTTDGFAWYYADRLSPEEITRLQEISKDYPIYTFQEAIYTLRRELNRGGAAEKVRAYELEKMEAELSRLTDKTSQILSKNLDNLLAFPLLFLEIKEHASARRNNGNGYGKLSDIRGQSFGMEYRTTPSWLANEELAKSVLCLAYAVAHETINSGYQVENKLTDISGFQRAFVDGDKELLLPFLSVAEREAKAKLSLYPKYKNEIGYLFAHAKKCEPILDQEIKLGWKIPHEILRDIVLLSAKELVEKLVSLISLPPSGDVGEVFVVGSRKDYDCRNISKRINQSILSLLGKNQGEADNKVYIYGTGKDKGNTIKLSFTADLMEHKKSIRLAQILTNICLGMGFPEKIEVVLEPTPNFILERTIGNRVSGAIGLPRAIREHNSYLSEILVFIFLMFVNNSMYKSYRVSQKTGKKVSLPLLARTFLSPVKEKGLAGVQKYNSFAVRPEPTPDSQDTTPSLSSINF